MSISQTEVKSKTIKLSIYRLLDKHLYKKEIELKISPSLDFQETKRYIEGEILAYKNGYNDIVDKSTLINVQGDTDKKINNQLLKYKSSSNNYAISYSLIYDPNQDSHVDQVISSICHKKIPYLSSTSIFEKSTLPELTNSIRKITDSRNSQDRSYLNQMISESSKFFSCFRKIIQPKLVGQFFKFTSYIILEMSQRPERSTLENIKKGAKRYVNSQFSFFNSKQESSHPRKMTTETALDNTTFLDESSNHHKAPYGI